MVNDFIQLYHVTFSKCILVCELYTTFQPIARYSAMSFPAATISSTIKTRKGIVGKTFIKETKKADFSFSTTHEEVIIM